jgi:hypothetical protein
MLQPIVTRKDFQLVDIDEEVRRLYQKVFCCVAACPFGDALTTGILACDRFVRLLRNRAF